MHGTPVDTSNRMAEAKKRSPGAGCGFRALCSAAFRRRSRTLPRRLSSPNRSPISGVPRAAAKVPSFNLGRQGAGPDQAALIDNGAWLGSPGSMEKPRLTHGSQMLPGQQKGVPQQRQPVPRVSMELDSMIYDHQRAEESSALIRASSGNVMLLGHLGNLRVRKAAVTGARNVLDGLPKTQKEASSSGKTSPGNVGGGADSGMDGSISAKETVPVLVRMPAPVPVPKLRRPPSKRLVPEELNQMGSVEYGKGNLAEALTLFEQATIIAPERALYRNNKAVVLTGLGRLLEAVAGCREAVKIDPSYCRAHYRLSTLYLRLGEAERAMQHYQQAGEAGAKDMARASSLQNHLTKCSEARKRGDWHNMLKEAQSAISIGAHSAPKVFASQAEALLRLQRHQEAETALMDAPTFDIDASTKFFGAAANAYVLVVRAQVDMALGRFCDAVSTAQRAAWIDPRNMEITSVAQRARSVSLARTKGNNLFKASRFGEACAAYGEGLDHDPQNSVLLCNRAACQSELGHWEKAIEDCNLALSVRPSYKKARLRRAGCYAKLERWEDSVQDYRILIQQLPGDEEVLNALAKVRSQLKQGDA